MLAYKPVRLLLPTETAIIHLDRFLSSLDVAPSTNVGPSQVERSETSYLDNPLHMLKAINSWNKPLRPLWNKPSNFLDLYGPQPGAIYTYNSPLCFCSYCLVYFFSPHQYFSLLNPFFIFSDIIAFSLVGIDRIQGSLYHITELYAFKQSGE